MTALAIQEERLVPLSHRENILFKTFKRKKITTVDDLMDALKENGEDFRGGSRSVTVSVRYLAYKIAPRGYSIVRISSLGRGNKARYRLHRPGASNGGKRQRRH